VICHPPDSKQPVLTLHRTNAAAFYTFCRCNFQPRSAAPSNTVEWAYFRLSRVSGRVYNFRSDDDANLSVGYTIQTERYIQYKRTAERKLSYSPTSFDRPQSTLNSKVRFTLIRNFGWALFPVRP